MNLRYFPFDKHTCQIEFMQVTRYGVNFSKEDESHYEREGIVFQNGVMNTNLQFLIDNGEWELINLKLDTNPRKVEFKGSIITYPIYTVTFELERKPSFYVMILMLPSILVSLISVIGFLLPSESGEKVSLQLTALLSYSLVFLVIVDIIPPIGGNFPLIGIWFIFFKIIYSIFDGNILSVHGEAYVVDNMTNPSMLVILLVCIEIITIYS